MGGLRAGAAILRVLDLLDAASVAKAVTEGQSPAEVLIEYLGVTLAEAPQLLADTRAGYDPDNELPAAAERAAAMATTEGPVFTDRLRRCRIAYPSRHDGQWRWAAKRWPPMPVGGRGGSL